MNYVYPIFQISIEITNKHWKNYRNIYCDCKDIDGFKFAAVENFPDSILAICRVSVGTMRKKVNYFLRELRSAKNIMEKTKDIFNF